MGDKSKTKGRALVVGIWGIMVLSVCGQTNPPPVEWQKVYGGEGIESISALYATSDGGALLLGESASSVSGSKSSAFWGQSDYWAVKLDAHGDKEWDRSYGGDDYDFCFAVSESSSGGYFLGGVSESTSNGNRTSPNPDPNSELSPLRNGWLVRIDDEGDILWDRGYQGIMESLIGTADGGLVVGGKIESTDLGEGEVAGFGQSDLWIAQLDKTGEILWEHRYGGTNWDWGSFIRPVSRGGFIVGATSSSSPGGNKTSPHYGDYDYWILRLNHRGEKIWEQSFGGSGFELLNDIIQTKDGGFLVGGGSASGVEGNKTKANLGDMDVWIIKFDKDGQRIWEKTLGGSGYDRATSIIETWDGGFLVTANSDSPVGGMKQSPIYGKMDVWVIRLDKSGNLLWEQSFGGNSEEDYPRLVQVKDGGYAFVCNSYSPISGNKTEPREGSLDLWIVKLRPDILHLRPLITPGWNPSQSGFRFQLSGPTNTYVLDYSTNLQQWIPFQTNVLHDNSMEVMDASSAGSRQRYYRARTLLSLPSP